MGQGEVIHRLPARVGANEILHPGKVGRVSGQGGSIGRMRGGAALTGLGQFPPGCQRPFIAVNCPELSPSVPDCPLRAAESVNEV